MAAGACVVKGGGKVNGDFKFFSFFFFFIWKTLHADQSEVFVIFLNTSHTNPRLFGKKKKKKKNAEQQGWKSISPSVEGEFSQSITCYDGGGGDAVDLTRLWEATQQRVPG